MKIKFLKDCRDKHTEEYYSQGKVKEFDDERALEIISTGYAEEYVEPIEEPTPEEPKEMKAVNIADMTVAELRQCASDLGLDTKGKKAELLERIEKYLNE